MSSTPEINRSVKFSPYGKPISKTLLTPCRPLGLSRKRKTPGSSSKTPLTSTNDSISPLVTPLNYNLQTTPLSPIGGNTPVNKRLKRDVKENSERAVKKCLDKNFKNTIQEKKESVFKAQKASCLVPQKSNKSTREKKESEFKAQKASSPVPQKSNKSKDSLNNVKVCLYKLSEDDVKTYKNSSEFGEKDENVSNSSDEESEEFIKIKKRKAVILSDNEDFDGFSAKETEAVEEAVTDDLNDKNKQTLDCEEELPGNCNDVQAPKPDKPEQINNTQNIHLEESTNNINVSEMSEVIEVLSGSSSNSEKIKKNSKDELSSTKPIILSEDEDFMDTKENKKKLKLCRTESLEKKQKCKVDNNINLKSTKSSEKNSKTLKSLKSSTSSILDDEEDAFTSTPEREKSEKIALIEKIKIIENEVKQKRKNLEDLKQSQIYKSKHNVEQLKILSNVWREGCVKGLNDLLSKLQMHGPMNMSTLLNNLKISSEMVKSLKLNLDEEKKDDNKLSDGSEDFEN